MDENNVIVISQSNYDEEESYRRIRESALLDFISPGMKIVIKPNLLMDKHFNSNAWEDMITNPALIRSVIRIVGERLCDSGRISVIDGPTDIADFSKLTKILDLGPLFSELRHKGIDCELIDLRDMCKVRTWGGSGYIKRKTLQSDPRGKVDVFLTDAQSAFNGFPKEKDLHAILNETDETNEAHRNGLHHYSVSKTALMADVFINMPKMKVHKKAGITCSMKNLVGINTHKNYLPHYSTGSIAAGGDEFPYCDAKSLDDYKKISFGKKVLERFKFLGVFSPIYRFIGEKMFGKSEEVIRVGSWYGNDTLWRTVIDLNKVIMYSDAAGKIGVSKRKYISIVDGIIAGEGNGPMEPEPRKLGKIVCGYNPVAVDSVCLKYMRFNQEYIPQVKNAFNIDILPLINTNNPIKVKVDNSGYAGLDEIDFSKFEQFKIPSVGWDILKD